MRKKLRILKLANKSYIVVENEAFDWEVEPDQIKKIELKIKNDPTMKENCIGSIFTHLVSCFSEFVGKKVTLQEINDAIDNGYIEA